MGKNSSIEWTHHTFNPWWGCAKISPACENCYAEKWSKRTGDKIWGVNTERRFFSENHWKEPLRWNKKAGNSKNRERVFCASMSDVFEKRNDLDKWRKKLWYVIKETPNLDWLLLTKRAHNIDELTPWNDNWPTNVWLGVTVENQKIADERIPLLLKSKAKLHFISCEPLLGEIEISKWLGNGLLDWVIVGGESGGKARPTHADWIRSLKDQCVNTKVPFLFKQWGCWRPILKSDNGKHRQLRIDEAETMIRMSKKAAGRELDGKVWNEVP